MTHHSDRIPPANQPRSGVPEGHSAKDSAVEQTGGVASQEQDIKRRLGNFEG
jgi:hypothetical protein